MWVSLLCVAAMGCAENLTPPDDAAVGADVVGADVVGTDVVGTDVVGTDVVGADVVGTDVPPTCEAPSSAVAPGASSRCRAQRLTVDPMSLCGSVTRCPVVSVASLHCDDASGYGPWVTADGTGASVLFVTNVGGFTPRLFSLPAGGGALRVEDVAGVGVASTVLRADPAGGLHILYGERPGATDLARGASGWARRRLAPNPPSGGLFPTDARFAGEVAHAVWFNFNDHSAELATGRDGCWSARRIHDTVQTDLALSLDRAGAPWVAYYASASGSPVLRTLAPDGMIHELWRATGQPVGLNSREMPRFVAGGIDGQGRWPVALVREPDGLTLRLRADAATTWTSVLLPDAALDQSTGDCPSGEPVGPGDDPCNGLRVCAQRTVGSSGIFGLARTASGALWAVWAQRDDTVDYSLRGGGCMGGGGGGGPGVDAGGPPRCVCMSTPTGSRGTLTLRVGQVTPSGVTVVGQLRFDTGGPVPNYFDVAARGEHLLVVVPMHNESGLDLRYLDLDLNQTP